MLCEGIVEGAGVVVVVVVVDDDDDVDGFAGALVSDDASSSHSLNAINGSRFTF